MIQKHSFYLVIISLFVANSAYPLVEWSGNYMPNVLDENLIITGDCQMPYNNDVYVKAHEADITITMTRDATVRGNNLIDYNNDFVTHGIYLEVYYPYTITIYVSHELTFTGAEGYLEKPLAVYVQGNGTVQWILADSDNAKVHFTANHNSGGAELWTRLLSGVPIGSPTTPTMTFEARRKNQLSFGLRSRLGYQIFSTYNSGSKTTFEHEKARISFDNFTQFALKTVNF